MPAHDRKVPAGEAAVEMWERLAIDERKSAGKGADLQRFVELAAAVFAVATAAGAQFEFVDGAETGDDGGIDFLLTSKLDQATHQFFAGFQVYKVTELGSGKIHIASHGPGAAKIANPEPGATRATLAARRLPA